MYYELGPPSSAIRDLREILFDCRGREGEAAPSTRELLDKPIRDRGIGPKPPFPA
jgi:hypothetical protein